MLPNDPWNGNGVEGVVGIHIPHVRKFIWRTLRTKEGREPRIRILSPAYHMS